MVSERKSPSVDGESIIRQAGLLGKSLTGLTQHLLGQQVRTLDSPLMSSRLWYLSFTCLRTCDNNACFLGALWGL